MVIRKIVFMAGILGNILGGNCANYPQKVMSNKPTFTEQWDKKFPKSDKVSHRKVTFRNRYGITLAGDLYMPKDVRGKIAAIAVSGPYGAVKEQSSGLYAQTMAEQGFVTLAFDPSYTGESGGTPRHVSSPDINTEDFSAAVDFLGLQEEVDRERIGIIGICGWGGMALNATAIDIRIKAVATIVMYDMSRVIAHGYFDSHTPETRKTLKEQLAAQRLIDSQTGTFAPASGGLPEEADETLPKFIVDYANYYKKPRGFHERSINSNGAWTATNALSFMNMPLLSYANEISVPVLIIAGEKAHSRYFSEDAYRQVGSDDKELLIIPGASHVDLYDNEAGVIPFGKLANFFHVKLT